MTGAYRVPTLGGRVRIKSHDPIAVAAIHDFVLFKSRIIRQATVFKWLRSSLSHR